MAAPEGSIQSAAVTIPAPGFEVGRFVVSFDIGDATIGTAAITFTARGMVDEETPDGDSFDATADQRQFQVIGFDVGSVTITPDSLDEPVGYRVAFFEK